MTECLCQMRRRCHGEGESEFFLGDKASFIGEDGYVSQMKFGWRLLCICASVIKVTLDLPGIKSTCSP